MMSRIRKYLQPALSIILLCICLANTWNSSQNLFISQKEQDKIFENIEIDPNMSDATSFQTNYDIYMLNEPFDLDVFTVPNTNWTRSDSSQVTWYTSNSIRLYEAANADPNTHYMSYYISPLNGNKLGFTNAQMNITWSSANFPGGSDGIWQFSKNNESPKNISRLFKKNLKPDGKRSTRTILVLVRHRKRNQPLKDGTVLKLLKMK